MRKMLRSAVLAGAALAAAGTAVAATQASRVMTVGLPDGSVARIEYQGDVAPKVRVEPVLRFVPLRYAEGELASPFALFDRIAADMDRQMAVMMRQAQMVEAAAAARDVAPGPAQLAGMPAGTVSYHFVSTSTGSGTCSRSVQVVSFGGDQQPRVVSSSSGDCGPSPRQPVPVSTPAPRTPGPETI